VRVRAEGDSFDHRDGADAVRARNCVAAVAVRLTDLTVLGADGRRAAGASRARATSVARAAAGSAAASSSAAARGRAGPGGRALRAMADAARAAIAVDCAASAAGDTHLVRTVQGALRVRHARRAIAAVGRRGTCIARCVAIPNAEAAWHAERVEFAHE